MVKSISVYETNLNSRRKRAAERNVIPGHVVYVLGKNRVDSFKVGRTKDFSARMSAYRGYLGPDVAAIVQIEVADLESAKVLEKEFITALVCAEARRGREWFAMPYPELSALVMGVLAVTKANVLKVRGAPCAREKFSDQKQESVAIAKIMRSSQGPNWLRAWE